MLKLPHIFVVIACLITAFAPPALAQQQPIVIADYPRYGMVMPPTFRATLQPLITTIIGTVAAGGTVRVRVYGHADFDAQGREFETKVSVERATVAQQTLLSSLLAQAELAGISRDKLLAGLDVTIQGMGTKQPKVTNPRNELERKENRRVEFFWDTAGVNPQPPPRPSPPEPAPDNTSLRVVGFGIWTGSSTVHIRGEQMVRFVIENQNLLGTTISITDMTHGGKKSRMIPPRGTAEIEFAILKAGPINWTFGVDTDSDAFVISWQALSFAQPPGSR
jgi:hypothetical protein